MGSRVSLSTQCLQQPSRMLLVISILVSVGVCAGFPGYPKRYFAINNSSAEAVGIAQSALFLQNTKAMTQWKLYSVLSVEKQVSVIKQDVYIDNVILKKETDCHETLNRVAGLRFCGGRA